MKKIPTILLFFLFFASMLEAQSPAFSERFGGAPFNNFGNGPQFSNGDKGRIASETPNGNISNQNNTNLNNNQLNSKNSIFPQFNPYLDNHLNAPEEKEKSGLFGFSIFEVEEILRNLGARNYSYAFGKNSRMVLSKYMIVLNFDRNKKLGSVCIKAMKPYKHIPPIAKKYFMDLFLGDSNMESYSIKLSSTELEIKYNPNKAVNSR